MEFGAPCSVMMESSLNYIINLHPGALETPEVISQSQGSELMRQISVALKYSIIGPRS